MWRSAFNIILILNNDLVSANYVINNSSSVTWRDAQKLCNVPSVGDIMFKERGYTELPKTFIAWTSSLSSTSYWTFFHGCLDIPVDMITINDTKTTLNQYFPSSTSAIESESVFKCAYFCTSKGDIFTFFRHVCKCIYENELKSKLLMFPVCIFWDSTKMENIDGVYSISRRSLPIFKFETALRKKNIQKFDKKHRTHHCLAKTNGTFTTNGCNSTKIFTCDAGFNGNGTWATAIYKCVVNGSLLKKESDFSDYWLGYFMYEEDRANAQCVSIMKDTISQSLFYQFRPCSDHLPVVCKDGYYTGHVITSVFVNQFPENTTEPVFEGTTKQTSTDISEEQRPDLFIVAGGAASLTMIIIFLLVIIYIQRRKLIKAAFTSLTVRRDQSNYNEIPQQMSESTTRHYDEVSPLSEIAASECHPADQQNIEQIQHIDLSGYLVPSNM